MNNFNERGADRRKTTQKRKRSGLFTRPFGDRIVISKDRRKTPIRRDEQVMIDNQGNILG
jgi:hypothetical protein